jgi:hypothetical protein
MLIDIRFFGGMAPSMAQHLLKEGSANLAENVRLGSGEIRPLRLMLPVHAFSYNAYSVYNFNGSWLGYADGGRNFVPSASTVTPQRLYMSKYMGGAQIYVDGSEYGLGVLEPTEKPSGTSSGGTGSEQARSYVYTCVSTYGEEGPPSPPSDIITSNDTGATVSLTGLATPDTTGTDHPPITKKRIYRSATGGSGNADFLYVDEIDEADTIYSDFKEDDELGETLPSLGWRKPPMFLTGLTAMSGGLMAGFKGREVRLCEPWQPHAWPDKYSHELDYSIMAIAAVGRVLYILTTGPVYQMVVNDPESAVPERMPGNVPCVYGEASWSTPFGVVYASVDGLYLAGPASATPQRLTGGYYDEPDWKEFIPSSLHGAWHGGQLFIGFETYGGRVGTLILSQLGAEVLISTTDLAPDAFTVVPDGGALYVSHLGTVYKWEGNQTLSMVGRWRSKEYVTPEPSNFASALIEADYTALASEEELEEDLATAYGVVTGLYGGVHGGMAEESVGMLPFASDEFGLLVSLYDPDLRADQEVWFRLYGDGVVRYAVRVGNDRPFALPSGYQARRWFFEVEATKAVKRISVAESAGEIYT